MTIKWIKTAHKGLRFYEHHKRKHGKQRDRYYSIRFKVGGKDYDYGVGWMSEGIPEEIRKEEPELGFQDYCLKLLRQFKGNIKSGSGPRSPKEKREIADKERERSETEKKRAAKENITYGDFMTKTYLPNSKRDKKEKTYKIEETLYRRHLAGTIGNIPISKISPFHLELIKKKLGDKKKSARTIYYALQVVRQSFNSARKLGIYAGESPVNAVKWPKLDNMKLRYLSIEEAEKLLKALALRSQTLHDMALLSLHSGLRFGEIAALTWSCVNFEAGSLAILNAKTGSRTAYLTKRAKAMLESRKSEKKDELVFPKKTKEGGEINYISKTFNETVNDLGLNDGIIDSKQKVTFHTLRHTFATHLYESTNDLYLTQKSLGHTTGTMTARYAKMSDNRLREGATALEKTYASYKRKSNSGKIVNIKN